MPVLDRRARDSWALVRYVIGHSFEVRFYYVVYESEHIQEPRENTVAGNQLILWMGIMAILMMSIYQGSLLTHLLHPPITRPFKNSDDLVRKVGAHQVRVHLKKFSYTNDHSCIWYCKVKAAGWRMRSTVQRTNSSHACAMRQRRTRSNSSRVLRRLQRLLNAVCMCSRQPTCALST